MEILIPILIGIIVILLLTVIPAWKIYKKAGQPGWACIVPIYSTLVMLKIVKKPLWWFWLLCIPGVNIVIGIIVTHRLSLVFGKGTGFTVGLLLLTVIFLPILGYGSAVYNPEAVD